MKNILSIIFGSFLMIGLNGCVSNPAETQARYDRMNQQDLCMDYLYYDWMNIYQQYRENSIIKRQIDCGPYVEMAAYKYQRDRAAWNAAYGALGVLSNPGGSTSYGSSGTSLSSGFTKVCYYDGMSGPSALTVLSTSICPLSHSHNVSGMTKICNYPNAMGGPKAITISTMSMCPLNYPG